MTRGRTGQIRWLRLKKIAESIAGCPVAIHGSTELPVSLRAAVDAEEGRRVDIALNFQHIKEADEALEAVAHELAHVVARTGEHDNKFEEAREEILERLKQDYYRSG